MEEEKDLVAIVLGSGQDAGLPQLGAMHRFDWQARSDPKRIRLGPSVCIMSLKTGKTLLLDVSPDIKQQQVNLLNEQPAYKARYERNSTPVPPPFDFIALTHAHMGHYAGLVHFGKEAAHTRGVPLFGTARMCDFLTKNAPWSQLVSLENVSLKTVEPEKDVVEVWPGLRMKFISVPHRSEFTDTVGISINDKLLYIPDIDSWATWQGANEVVASHKVCLLDATFFDNNELPGRDLSTISHPFVVDTLKRFGHLLSSTQEEEEEKKKERHRIILTHLNHSNPLTDSSTPAYKVVEDAGFEVASDMMCIYL